MNGRKVFESDNINQYNNYVSQNNKSGMYLVDLISTDCRKVFKIVQK